jgi:hypothetical protein
MRKFILFSAIGLSFSGYAFADETATPASATTPASAFKASAYIDASYNYLLRADHFSSAVFDRVFDLNPNGVTLQQASLTLAYQPQTGFGALVNPIMGKDPLIFASYGINPNLIDSQWLGFDVPQAFIQYAIGSFTLEGGRFVTLAGAEVIDPTQNTNFSRSILFGFAIPFTQTGLRGVYVYNDKLTLNLGVNDGWDNVRDWGRGKTVEGSIIATINPIFSFTLDGLSGDERATPFTDTGPIGRRNLVDFIGTCNVTNNLTLILNYDYAWQTAASLPDGSVDKAIWTGAAGYINYKFSDSWKGSFRGEAFNDQDGFRTGIVQVWKELTLSLTYIPTTYFEIRGETRYDFSNVESFVNRGSDGLSKNNQSFAVEAFLKF